MQLCDGGLWSRIRKFLTQPAKENTQRTHREQTEKAIREATLIPWIIGFSGPIVSKLIMILAWLKDIAQ